MFLLDALKRLLGHDREKQERDSLNPPIPTSAAPLQDRLHHDESRPPLYRLPPAQTSSSSAKGSIFLAPQSEASSSKKPSLATVSSTNSPNSKAPASVWPPYSTTKLAEKPSLSSPTLPSSRKDAISHASPSLSNPAYVFTANNSVSSQKNKQISTLANRESVQSLPAFSPSVIKFVRPDSCSSSNTSPSSLLESGISYRRVLPKYEIPKYLEEMIRNDNVPPVLMGPLSPSTYSDFFATLLYAEDFYAELVQARPSDQNTGQYLPTLSSTGLIIQVALVNIYRSDPRCRILVCAPTNDTSDLLLRNLRKEIPYSNLFRANAAYRDYDLVPDDIIPSSLYEEDEERFTCPPLAELKSFNIITCTFMSSFRLYAAGLDSEHFTHIFLVDSSLATEPEAIVPLAHFVGRNTIVVVTGCSNKSPYWVRADIARKNGLKVSYFNRLLAREPYLSNDSVFIAHLA